MKITDVTVQVLSKDKILQLFKMTLQPDEFLHTEKFAAYKELFKIDTDCCFEILKENFLDTSGSSISEYITAEVSIWKAEINADNPLISTHNRIKSVNVLIPHEYFLRNCESMPLVEFIRFNYNPRIIGNQKLLMDYILRHES